MITEKTYLKPKTVKEAISFAKENEKSFRYLAGGTDVIVNKFQGNDDKDCLIDISGIDELNKIIRNEKFLKIGSLVRLDDLKNHSEIRNEFPALMEAAHSVGSPLIRRTATIGGNILCENRCIFYNQSEWWRQAAGYCLKCDGDICIATGGTKKCFSKFVSDTAPVLIAYNALVETQDEKGSQTIPLEKIYTGDGLHPRNLSPTAIVKSVLLPLGKNFVCIFKKLRPREAVDFTSLTTAVSLDESGKIRIALGGIDPGPVLVEGTLSDNADELIAKVKRKSRAVNNDVYSRVYRKEMIEVFLNESFEELPE